MASSAERTSAGVTPNDFPTASTTTFWKRNTRSWWRQFCVPRAMISTGESGLEIDAEQPALDTNRMADKGPSVERDGRLKQILNDRRKEVEPTAIKFRQRSSVFSTFLPTGVVFFVIDSFSGSSKSGWHIGSSALCNLSGVITVFFFFRKLRSPKCFSGVARGPAFFVLNTVVRICRYIISFSAKNAVTAEGHSETARVEVIECIIVKIVACI